MWVGKRLGLSSKWANYFIEVLKLKRGVFVLFCYYFILKLYGSILNSWSYICESTSQLPRVWLIIFGKSNTRSISYPSPQLCRNDSVTCKDFDNIIVNTFQTATTSVGRTSRLGSRNKRHAFETFFNIDRTIIWFNSNQVWICWISFSGVEHDAHAFTSKCRKLLE